MKSKNRKEDFRHFPSVPLERVNRRVGKHYQIVSDILSDLANLDSHSAIKIDLAKVGKKKAHLRAAILRTAKKKKINLATTSDEKHLYIFRSSPRTNEK